LRPTDLDGIAFQVATIRRVSTGKSQNKVLTIMRKEIRFDWTGGF
jgi:hypothetical protein